jgi:histidyl-tRNA synthetase
MTVEAEVIAAGSQVLLELGFTAPDAFAIRLNHRAILHGLMEVAGVPPALEGDALVAIDKLDKIGMDGVRTELEQRGIAEVAASHLLRAMAAAPTGNADTLAWLRELLASSETGTSGINEIAEVVAFSAYGPAADRLRVDPYLARGLSYYTGPIFEIEFPGLSGSGGGGGRYDDLIGMFSGQRIPSCGFSLGLERILLIMEERGLFPSRLAGEPQVLVTQFDASTVGASLGLAQELRRAGIRADVYPDTDRYGRQFKYAEERRIRYALLVSPREIAAGVVAVKDLESGDQVDVPRSAIADAMLSWLRADLT